MVFLHCFFDFLSTWVELNLLSSELNWQGNVLYDLVPRVKQRIIDSFTPEANDVFLREFHFIDKVTSISGVLYPLPKEERRAGIRRL